MKINTKRLFSSLLSLMMVVNMVPPEVAFATETGEDGVLTQQTDESYTEEISFVNDDDDAGGYEGESGQDIVNEPTDGEPVDEPTDGEPVDEPADGEPVDEPTDGEPVDEPTDGEPVDKPTDGEPVDEPADGEPVDKPADGELVDEPVDGEPASELPNEEQAESEEKITEKTRLSSNQEMQEESAEDTVLEENVELAALETNIEYVGGDTPYIPNGATEVTAEVTTWSDGWYYVPSEATINDTVTVTGDVNLVLGGDLIVNGSIDITGTTNDTCGSLKVYAKKDVTRPELIVTNDSGSGIYFTGGDTTNGSELTMVSPAVLEVTGSEDGIQGDGVSPITLDGNITVSGDICGISNAAGYERNIITISGGTMSIHGEECAIYSGGVTQTAGTVEVTSGNCAIIGYSGSEIININGGKMIIESPQLSYFATFDNATLGQLYVKVNGKEYPYGGQIDRFDPFDLSKMELGAYYEVVSSSSDYGYAIYGKDKVLTLHNVTLEALTVPDDLTELKVNLEGKNYLENTISLTCPLTLTGDGSLKNNATLEMDNQILTLNGNSKFINQSSVTCSGITRSGNTAGTLANYGTITFDDSSIDSTVIQGLGISGDGIVVVGSAKYDNNGNPLGTAGGSHVKENGLSPDEITNATDDNSLDTKGYHWDEDSQTLTIKNLTIMGNPYYKNSSLVLPTIDSTTMNNITIKVIGDCFIENGISSESNAYGCKLTIKSEKTDNPNGEDGTLAVNGSISLSKSLTISNGVKVKAQSISLGDSGAVGNYNDVIVNGILEVNSNSFYGITAGKMLIGSTGKVNVSGECGIKLTGYVTESDLDTFKMEEKDGSFGQLIIDCESNALEAVGIDDNTESIITLPDVPSPILPEPYEIKCFSGNDDYGYTIVDKNQPDPIYYGRDNGFEGDFSSLSLGDPLYNLFLSKVELAPHSIYDNTDKTISVTDKDGNSYPIEGGQQVYDITHNGSLKDVGKIPYRLSAKGTKYYGVKRGTLEIVPSQTKLDPVTVYKNDEQLTASPLYSFTYGDKITVKVTPEWGEALRTATFATYSASPEKVLDSPTAGQMALFYGGMQISEPANLVDGKYTMTYDTISKKVPCDGEKELTAKYVKDSNTGGAKTPVTVQISKYDLTNATVKFKIDDKDSPSTNSIPYDGKEHKLTVNSVTRADGKTIPAEDYTLTDSQGNELTQPIIMSNAGSYKVIVNPKTNTEDPTADTNNWYSGSKEATFSIGRSDSSLELNTYKNEDYTNEVTAFTYGDKITVKAKPKLKSTPGTKAAAASLASTTEPGKNKMWLVSTNGTLLAVSEEGLDEKGFYTMTYDTNLGDVPCGTVTLTVKFGGDDNYEATTQNTAELTIGKIDLSTAKIVEFTGTSFVYNGNPQSPAIKVKDSPLPAEGYDVSYTDSQNNTSNTAPTDAGDYKATVKAKTENPLYQGSVEKKFSITPFETNLTLTTTGGTFTYGNTITVTATPNPVFPSTITENQIALYYINGGTETPLSKATGPNTDGSYTMTYDTTDSTTKQTVPFGGPVPLTVKYTGNEKNVTLTNNTLDNVTISKYDLSKANVTLTLDGNPFNGNPIIYDGNEHTLAVSSVTTNDNKPIPTTEYTSTPVTCKDKGEYKVTVKATDSSKWYSNQKDVTFKIVQSATEFEDGNLKVYKDGDPYNNGPFTYGDTIIVEATPTWGKTAANTSTLAAFDEPAEKQMALFYCYTENGTPKEIQLSDAVDLKNGKYTMKYITTNSDTNKIVPFGTGGDNGIPLTAKYVGDANTADASKTFNVKIAKYNLSNATVELSNGTFTYNGNPQTPTATVKTANGIEIPNTEYSVNYSDSKENTVPKPTNADTYNVSVTATENNNCYIGTADKKARFTIDKFQTSFTVTTTGTLTYGNTITVTATPKAGFPDNITADQIKLFYDDTDLNAAVSLNSGTYTMTYDTKINPNVPFDTKITLTVKYAGNDNIKPTTGTVDVTIGKRNLSDAVVKVEGTYTYTGKPIEPKITVDGETVTDTGYTVNYTGDHTDEGTHTVTVAAKPENPLYTGNTTVQFTIGQSGTNIKPQAYQDKACQNQSDTFTYGDKIFVKVTPEATGKAPVTKAAPAANLASAGTLDKNKMALFYVNGDEETPLGIPVDPSGDGSYTMTYDTTDPNTNQKVPFGKKITLTVKYGGNNNLAATYGTVDVTINKHSIEAAVVTLSNETLTYNGSKQTPTVTVKMTNGSVIPSTNYSVKYSDSKDNTVTDPTNADTYNVSVTATENNNCYTGTTDQKPTFEIAKFTTSFDVTATGTLTYGNTITVKATPKKDLPSTITEDQIKLFYGDTPLSDGATKGADGSYTMTYDTTDSTTKTNIPFGGPVPLTVKYTGDDTTNIGSVKGTVDVTIGKRNLSDADVKVEGEYIYTGNPIEPKITVDGETVTDTRYTVTYPDGNTDKGTHTVTVTAKDDNPLYTGSVDKTFEIQQSATGFTAEVYKDENPYTGSFTYGDTITVVAKPPKPTNTTETAPAAYSNSTEKYPDPNKMALFYTDANGVENEISSEVPLENGVYTMTYDTTQKKVPCGNNIKLTVKYGGDANLDAAETTVDVTINKLTIKEVKLDQTSYTYDGTVKTPKVTVTLDKTQPSSESANDIYDVSYQPSEIKNAGNYKVTVKPKSGAPDNWDSWYTGEATKDFNIAKFKTDFTVTATGTPPYDYGNTITVTATPKAAFPDNITADQIKLFYGETELSTAKVENGSYIMIYDTKTTPNVPFGTEITLTVKYAGNDNIEPATGTVNVNVNKRSIEAATVTLSGGPFTYNGTPQTPTVTVTLDNAPFSDYNVSYQDSKGTVVTEPKNADTYTVIVTATGNCYTGTATATPTFVIGKADLASINVPNPALVTSDKPADVSITCTANPKNTSDTSKVVGTLTLQNPTSTTLDFVNSQEYTCKFTPTGDYAINYNELSNFTVNIQFKLKEAKLDSISATGTPTKTNYVYGDSFQFNGLTITARYTDNSTRTLNPPMDPVSASPLNAGDTSVTLSYTENGVTKTCQVTGITVAKKTLDMSGVAWTDGNFTYDGKPHGISLTGTLPAGVSVAKSGDTATNAGTYTASATFTCTDKNYTLSISNPLVKKWSIARAKGEDHPQYKEALAELEKIHIITNFYPNLAALKAKTLQDCWVFADSVDQTAPLSVANNAADQTQTFPMIYTPPDLTNYSPYEISHAFPVTTLSVKIEGNIAMCEMGLGDTKKVSVHLDVSGAALEGTEGDKYSAKNLIWKSDLENIATVTWDDTDHKTATVKAEAKGVTTVGVSFDMATLNDILLGYVLVQVKPKPASDGTENTESQNQIVELVDIADKLDKAIDESDQKTDDQKQAVKAVANEVTELPDSVKAKLQETDVATLDRLMNDVCGVKPDIKKLAPDAGNETVLQPAGDVNVTGVAVASVKKVTDSENPVLTVKPLRPTDTNAKMQLSVELYVGKDKIQPESPLFFTIKLPDELDPNKLKLLHIKDDNTTEELNIDSVGEDGKTISFKMLSLSHLQFVPTDIPTTTTPDPVEPEPNPAPSSGGSSSGGSGSGGSSSGPSNNLRKITVDEAEHGTVKPDRTSATAGQTVTLTAVPDEGYVLDSLTVTDEKDSQISLTTVSGSKYTFVMPGKKVTITATFVPDDSASEAYDCDGGVNCPSRAFTDLDTGKWYHEAVDYVLIEKMMNGFGNRLFRPNGMLSRAMLVQILYNREGHPQVEEKTGFTDVPSNAWYANAVYWAAANDIVNGFGNGLFGPDVPITREQLAVILWRYMGSPKAEATFDFSDASDMSNYAVEALRWAVANKVVNGHSDGRLDPKGTATRAQVAQMLMNLFKK